MFVRAISQFQYTVSIKSLPTIICIIIVNATQLVNQCDCVIPVESIGPISPYKHLSYNEKVIYLHKRFRSRLWTHAKLRSRSIARRLWSWNRFLSGLPYTPEGTSKRTDHSGLAQVSMQKDMPKRTKVHCKGFRASLQKRFVRRIRSQERKKSLWRPALCSCKNSSRRSSSLYGSPIFHELEVAYEDKRIGLSRSRLIWQLMSLLFPLLRLQYGPP
jgi:hypothetical protein